ncbi:MAG TPA: hypothetical protein VFV72_09385 [Candidatus Limnocylindrales bacterium]|nr:hypothetical protein [Candidatus Limnocylindrales bacterium]
MSASFQRLARIGGAVALATVAFASPAAAAAKHLDIEIHDGFLDDFLTEECGTTVIVAFDASLKVTLVYNDEGLIVREIDPNGPGRTTYTAPDTGNTFSIPWSGGTIDYGDGATIGSTWTSQTHGLLGHIPGYIASDAGRIVFSGYVSGFDEWGSPLIETTDVLFEVGNREGGSGAILEAFCAALTA